MHREQQRELGHLRHVALDVDRRHVGIEARSEVFREHCTDVVVQVRGVGVGREGVVIGDEEEAPCVVLHADEILQSTEIVAQMKPACGTYPAEYSIHDREENRFDRTNIRKIIRAMKKACRI